MFIMTDSSLSSACELRITVYFSMTLELSSFFRRSLTADNDRFTFLLNSEMETRELACRTSKIFTSIISIETPPYIFLNFLHSVGDIYRLLQ